MRTLNKARRSDLPELVRVWASGWSEAHADLVPDALIALRTEASFRDRAEAALDQTRLVRGAQGVRGFCITKSDEIYQMYVDAGSRGSGIAQMLIADGEERIAAQGHRIAWLSCAMGNGRAMRFYERCGWINAGRSIVLLDTMDGGFPLEVWRYEKRLAD